MSTTPPVTLVIIGHTLDLVITNMVPINNLHVYSLGVSDHNIISMELLFPYPCPKPKHQIQYRNLKSINPDALTQDLQHIFSGSADFQWTFTTHR